jgi:hypothetical protein
MLSRRATSSSISCSIGRLDRAHQQMVEVVVSRDGPAPLVRLEEEGEEVGQFDRLRVGQVRVPFGDDCSVPATELARVGLVSDLRSTAPWSASAFSETSSLPRAPITARISDVLLVAFRPARTVMPGSNCIDVESIPPMFSTVISE